MTNAATLFMLAYKLAPLLLRKGQQQQDPSQVVITEKDIALLELKRKLGAVIVILGTRGTGKTELAYRLAEFLEKPTYAVSPEQKPHLAFIERINFGEIDERVMPGSTVIFDDLPAYASNRDYNESLVRELERIIPMVRHERKLHLIFNSQSAAQADKYILDCDMAFLKPLGLLFEDLERPAIKKLYKEYVMPEFDGKQDSWIVRHAYMYSRIFKGVIEIKKVS